MLRTPSTLLASLSALVLLAGCSGADDDPPLEGDGTGRVPAPSAVEPTATSARCERATKKSCKVVIAEFDGVQSCFTGEATCSDDGSWGPCKKIERAAKK